MDVLLVGSGGREHALAWKLSQSSFLGKLYIAPGNPGTARCGQNVEIGVCEIDKLVSFARANDIELVVVGPEDPLAAGIVDTFEAAGIMAFGPSAAPVPTAPMSLPTHILLLASLTLQSCLWNSMA